MQARLQSLNVGQPRAVSWRGRQVSTGIYKVPVEHRLPLDTLNLEGDRQADLSVHGGPDKAVYAYPAEHYAWWQAELESPVLPWGSFGENCTTSGLFETDVHVGDRFRVGTAQVMVTQPRLPCYKLGLRLGRADMPKRFLASRRTGFYLRVVQVGEVGPGDPLELIHQDPQRMTVAQVTALYLARDTDAAGLGRALLASALPEGWRAEFRHRLQL
jgi:MOSC domain-containing protein YiiM